MDRFAQQLMKQIKELISTDVKINFSLNVAEENCDFKVIGPEDEIMFVLGVIIQLLAYQDDTSYINVLALLGNMIEFSRSTNPYAEDATGLEDLESEQSNNTGGMN